jgi:single-strand DNA-binding protein
MSNFNKVYLMGNLTRDPELRFTPKGHATAKLAMAINRKFQVDGEAREEVTFVDIEAWGKQAEAIAQYCKKGRPLFVEGRLKLDQWDDKTTGQKRSALKVVLEGFQFIGGRPADAEKPSAPRPATETAAPASAEFTQPEASTESDDLPF